MTIDWIDLIFAEVMKFMIEIMIGILFGLILNALLDAGRR